LSVGLAELGLSLNSLKPFTKDLVAMGLRGEKPLLEVLED